MITSGSRGARRVRVLAILLLAGLAAVACGGGHEADDAPTVANAGGDAGSASAGNGGDHGGIGAIASAVTADGPAELSAGVHTIDVDGVQAISDDGATFTFTSSAGGNLAAGDLFVVPGVAARRVVSTSSSGGSIAVVTDQPTVDELFSDLDVKFDQAPDPSAIVYGGDPVEMPGEEPTLAFGDLDEGAATPVRNAPAVRLTSFGAAAADGAGCATSGSADTATTTVPGQNNPNAEKEGSSVSGPKIKGGPYTITPKFSIQPGCPRLKFSAEVEREGDVEVKGAIEGSVTAAKVSGEMAKGPTGATASVAVDLSGDVKATLNATSTVAGGKVDRAKVSFNFLKMDVPVVIAGVPFIVRIGIPFILDIRFTGNGDLISATLVSMKCSGQLGTTGADTPPSTCTMDPSKVELASSIAPTALNLSVGFKLGFGFGTILSAKSIGFAGVTATLGASAGITYSGAAALPLVECSRIDRVVQLNLGGEVELFGGLKLNTSTKVWDKSATDQVGSSCPKS